jgi:AraC family transcriptional regulator
MIHSAITFGAELKKLKVADFILTETRHQPELSISRHDHENANFNFVIDGSLKETLGELFPTPEECFPGTILYKPPGEAHSNRYGNAGAHCLIVEFENSIAEEYLKASAALINPFRLPAEKSASVFMEIYREMDSTDAAAHFVIEGLILQILGQTIRTPTESCGGGGPKWLQEFLSILHEGFDHPLIFNTIARQLNIHPVHLQKTFRKYKGCSPGYYLRKVRIQFAAHRLVATLEPVSTIALSAGFYDQSHFCRTFKQFFGMSPKDFRRQQESHP